MDFIFECFFKDTLDTISRNGLQDRASRRNVLDHLNAIIGGCSDGQNMLTEEVARIAVLSAIRYHRDNKTANGDVCLMGKYHNILYIALRTCWDWGVRDSAVVVLLLEEIYECEKTFERIFLGALFGPNAPYFIAGWRSDFRDQDENTRAMVYFLHHATSLDLTFPVWISSYEQEFLLKFIDIPIESCGRSSPLRVALQANAPDLLLILLRYGANPNPPDGGSSVVFALLDKLTENGRNYVYQIVSCLQILLRNITIVEMPYKPILFDLRKEMFLQRYGTLLVDNIIRQEQIFGVMSLCHLCRCRIRDLLRNNSQLPEGIDTLRLPRRLQRYIDLMEEIEGTEFNNTNINKTKLKNETNNIEDTSMKEVIVPKTSQQWKPFANTYYTLNSIRDYKMPTITTTTAAAATKTIEIRRTTSELIPFITKPNIDSISEDDNEDEDALKDNHNADVDIVADDVLNVDDCHDDNNIDDGDSNNGKSV